MIEVRRSTDRGIANHGWLQSAHSFSFADYYDPRQMGFGVLRVINEDRVTPGQGFGTHSHRDMEIISYVLDGALEHRDSLGTGSVLRPGDVQRMSAGSGVTHSEFNASKADPVHFLQIWIEPAIINVRPSYAEAHFASAIRNGRLQVIVSPDERDRSIAINQDAAVYAGLLDGEHSVDMPLQAGRRAYVQVARGALAVNGVALTAGDGARLTSENCIHLRQPVAAEVLVFDLP